MSNARIVECTNAEYHSDQTAISHSGLDDVRYDPAWYEATRITKTIKQGEPSDALKFGTKLHNAILRPGKYPAGAKLVPDDVLNIQGHRKGMAWRHFEARYPGFELLKSGEPLWEMLVAGARHPMVRLLIETDGDYETSIFWHDDAYDVERKARLDFLHLDREIIVDVKSTATPGSLEDCAKECAKYGYHRQVPYYQDAVEEMYGVVPRFIFIFFSKEPPYRVETFELTESDIAIGRRQNERALETYAECKRTGIWLPKSHGHIERVALPGWARYEP